jgi:hypothetical protein
MRVIVLGAGGAHKTETAIARAVRQLGHPCGHVNVEGWDRYLKRLSRPVVRRLVDSFAPDVVIMTRPAVWLGEDTVRAVTRGRRSAFWYFDFSSDADDPFAAELASLFVDVFAAGIGVEDKLGDAIAVAEVDEDEPAVVAVGMDPTRELDLLGDVACPQDPAGMGAVTCFDGFHGHCL